MRAIEVRRFGGPEVLVPAAVAEPVPGAGQVLVKVAVAGVLFVETVIRRGLGGDYFPVKPPYVPGAGVAGLVISVGPGVDSDWIGRRVVTDTDNGGYAELAVAAVEALIPIPDGLGLNEASALLHDGSTALALFESVDIEPGERVLVQPAAGGLGTVLVQLAHAAGAHVVGAVRGAEKQALVLKLGADEVIGYGEPGEFDVVFDGLGGEIGQAAFGTLRQGGRFSNYGTASGSPTVITENPYGVLVRGMEQLAGFGPGRRRRAEQVMHDAAAGRITPVIGQTYPLERAADAHAAIEARRFVGKSLLLVAGER
jgi:NADPH2:quinone reductase